MDGLSSTRSSQDQAQYGEAHQEIRACTTIAKVLLDRGWNGVDRSRFVAEGKNLKGYEISIKEDQFDRIRAAAQAILAKKPEGSYEMDRWIACQFGDLKYLKEEIAKLWWWQKSSYINLGDSLGQLPLNIATRHTQVETVELLLSNGAIVDGSDPDKYQPLHIAARDGNVPMMAQLLNKNAPVNGLGAEN